MSIVIGWFVWRGGLLRAGLLLIGLLLSGCGQKGDLYLPAPPPETAQPIETEREE